MSDFDAARPGRTVETSVITLAGALRHAKHDDVVTEEPLEVRLLAGEATHTIATTMRTPGNDFELAAGFLSSEGILKTTDDIVDITYCVDATIDPEQRYNIVNVRLATTTLPDLSRFERHFTINSSCGVCGRAHVDALREMGMAALDDDARIPASLLYRLPERMHRAQRVFASTGGLHAAALFHTDGTLIAVREDVGRHNAVDKLIGWGRLENRLPFSRLVLMVSGRTSYEILQKAAAAKIPIVCAVSAPSSLAIELASAFNITLAGFVRDDRANIYAAPERITAG